MLDESQPSFGIPLSPEKPRSWHRYVAVGDSLSEGLGDPLAGGRTRGWAARLADHLRALEPDLEFTNLAVRGHLTQHALATQLEVALAHDPDLVSVFIGGNDVLLRRAFDARRFDSELRRLVVPFTDGSLSGRSRTVVLATLPDLTACSPLLPPVRGVLRRRIVAANHVIRELAREQGTVLLDAWADPRTRTHSMWSIDRIHPSADGHRLIAAGVADLLGVPIPNGGPQPAGAGVVDTVQRHLREAAWLLRHGRSRPTQFPDRVAV